MLKNLHSFSIMFLGICIVISSLLISKSLRTTQNDVHEQPLDKYEFITLREKQS